MVVEVGHWLCFCNITCCLEVLKLILMYVNTSYSYILQFGESKYIVLLLIRVGQLLSEESSLVLFVLFCFTSSSCKFI